MGSKKPLPSDPEVSVNEAKRPGGRCPICTAPTETAFRPFCSRRCSDVDLSRWLRGGYAIAGRTDVDEDGDDTIAANAARHPPAEPDDET
jgi:uncharacterized protein